MPKTPASDRTRWKSTHISRTAMFTRNYSDTRSWDHAQCDGITRQARRMRRRNGTRMQVEVSHIRYVVVRVSNVLKDPLRSATAWEATPGCHHSPDEPRLLPAVFR